ncbi:hypothetical protein RRG08_038210 [Elysia crispata]|uniref:Uncharacterized protein n=1 Tax=Elysia crispata TaxID=231223 RepID=A0AAE1AMW6_9GAST|nr:hypothetical protein RRG08_038210 [Elysia crispata]
MKFPTCGRAVSGINGSLQLCLYDLSILSRNLVTHPNVLVFTADQTRDLERIYIGRVSTAGRFDTRHVYSKQIRSEFGSNLYRSGRGTTGRFNTRISDYVDNSNQIRPKSDIWIESTSGGDGRDSLEKTARLNRFPPLTHLLPPDKLPISVILCTVFWPLSLPWSSLRKLKLHWLGGIQPTRDGSAMDQT